MKVDTSEDFARSIMEIMEDDQSPPKESILRLDKIITSDSPNLSLTTIVDANTLKAELLIYLEEINLASEIVEQ